MIILLFVTGCTTTIDLSEKSITNVIYQDITINSKDYDKLIDKLDDINLSKRKINGRYNKVMKITNSNGIHKFEFSDKSSLRYTFNNQIYYSKNKKTISYLIAKLDSLIDLYRNKNFFNFKIANDYIENSSDYIIKLDNTNHYFQLQSFIEIKNLSIHKVEKKNEKYHDIDLVYNKDYVGKENIIIRMNPFKEYYSYRISFTNKYNMKVSIIPSYDTEKETGELKYTISYEFVNKQ